MMEHSLWRFSRALHRAINERQPADLEALLDDEVDWAIYGPIDMFPFFGSLIVAGAFLAVALYAQFGDRKAPCDPACISESAEKP